MAGVTIDDIEHFDIYSCFPIAVEVSSLRAEVLNFGCAFAPLFSFFFSTKNGRNIAVE